MDCIVSGHRNGSIVLIISLSGEVLHRFDERIGRVNEMNYTEDANSVIVGTDFGLCISIDLGRMTSHIS